MAVAGAGQWGKNLVGVACALWGPERVSVVDPDVDRLRMVGKEYRVGTVHTALDSVLDDPDIEAVILATPASTHAALAREALLSGKHVFVEKPLALSQAEADEVVTLAEALDRVLMVGHLLLYQPAVRWIRDFLGSGGVGEVWNLHLERLNLGRVRTVENALWSLGVHDVAVLLYLVGRQPTSVQVVGQAVVQSNVEDDVYLHLTFPGKVQAHVHVSWLWPEKRRGLTVVGSRAMVTYDEVSQQVRLHRKMIGEGLSAVDNGSEVVFHSEAEPLRLELEDFLGAVRERRRPLSDGRMAVDVVAVLEEASRQLGGR